MKIFRSFERVSNMQQCKKDGEILLCKQINEPFCVQGLQSPDRHGMAGDYIVTDENDCSLSICAKEAFDYEVLAY